MSAGLMTPETRLLLAKAGIFDSFSSTLKIPLSVIEIIHTSAWALDEFLKERPVVFMNKLDKRHTYIASGEYLKYLRLFHEDPAVVKFHMFLLTMIATQETVIDVGCGCGFTGWPFAVRGSQVSFHDFEGLGLEFIRQWSHRMNFSTQVLAYGHSGTGHDWALAFDVLEHTGNHLGAIKWLRQLGEKVALCYPIQVEHQPPYAEGLDEWVDDEAIGWMLNRRYRVLESYVENGRRFLIYT